MKSLSGRDRMAVLKRLGRFCSGASAEGLFWERMLDINPPAARGYQAVLAARSSLDALKTGYLIQNPERFGSVFELHFHECIERIEQPADYVNDTYIMFIVDESEASVFTRPHGGNHGPFFWQHVEPHEHLPRDMNP